MTAETIDFAGEDFLLQNAQAKALYRVNAATSRSSTTTATCRRGRSPRTGRSKT